MPRITAVTPFGSDPRQQVAAVDRLNLEVDLAPDDDV
jgi:hypothetical protein